MTRRPFDEGSALALWNELLALRQTGLDPDRIEGLAPTLVHLSPLRARWSAARDRRGEVVRSYLLQWLLALKGDQGYFARIAFGVGDEAEASLPTIGRRREAAAEARGLDPDGARWHEDQAIARFVQDLLAVSGVSPQRDGEEMTVQLALPDGTSQSVPVRQVDQRTPRLKQFRTRLLHHTYEYAADRRIVHMEIQVTVQATDPGLRIWDNLIDFAGVPVWSLTLKLRNCKLHNLEHMPGGFLFLHCDLGVELAVGDEHTFGVTAEIEGERTEEPGRYFAVVSPVDVYTMEIRFSSKDLPSRVWWFDDLPADAPDGTPAPHQILPVSEASPTALHVFEDLAPGPYQCGITWRW